MTNWREQRGSTEKRGSAANCTNEHWLTTNRTNQPLKSSNSNRTYNNNAPTNLDLEATWPEPYQIARGKGERQRQLTWGAVNQRENPSSRIEGSRKHHEPDGNRLVSPSARAPPPMAPSLPICRFEALPPKWNSKKENESRQTGAGNGQPHKNPGRKKKPHPQQRKPAREQQLSAQITAGDRTATNLNDSQLKNTRV